MVAPSEKKPRVAVAMSGGVDSSVAAGLLVQQGYDVFGIMLRLWSEPGAGKDNRCCTPDAMALARRVAAHLEIPFYPVGVQDVFREKVVAGFIQGYLDGVTPNPCLMCNRDIRWGVLYERAQLLGADFLATGHYARILRDPAGECQLSRGVDLHKDQSYVLSVLTQEKLAHTIFPLGEYVKPDVRQIARDMQLPVAERAESQDLCFLADGDYHRFLREQSTGAENPGQIQDRAGNLLGEHHGLAFYTIGQRKGLGVYGPEPFYVLEKDREHNRLIVGLEGELGTRGLVARQVNWISGRAPAERFRAEVKIRYKAREAWGWVETQPEARVRIEFDEPVRDITPGQAAVVYNGDICLGGGIIEGS
jgi:tRNA-uridine 2-sulfurtransferase